VSVFIDTSAFLTILDADDPNNRAAAAAWGAKIDAGELLITTNYVVVETIAVVHRRHGLAPVRWFVEDMLPVVCVQWTSPEIHAGATKSLLAGSRTGPSLVDCASFAVIDELNVRQVLAYDRHFENRGFELIGR